MLRELRLVLSEVQKCDQTFFSSSQKEPMIGYLNMLEHNLHGVDKNVEYYQVLAKKYVYEILGDTNVPLATLMLTKARASKMENLPKDVRRMWRDDVVTMLAGIRAEPLKVHNLEQDWKTYVRIARMMFSWRHMFFGLRFERSFDLHVKSYMFFARYCYKKA